MDKLNPSLKRYWVRATQLATLEFLGSEEQCLQIVLS